MLLSSVPVARRSLRWIALSTSWPSLWRLPRGDGVALRGGQNPPLGMRNMWFSISGPGPLLAIRGYLHTRKWAYSWGLRTEGSSIFQEQPSSSVQILHTAWWSQIGFLWSFDSRTTSLGIGVSVPLVGMIHPPVGNQCYVLWVSVKASRDLVTLGHMDNSSVSPAQLPAALSEPRYSSLWTSSSGKEASVHSHQFVCLPEAGISDPRWKDI